MGVRNLKKNLEKSLFEKNRTVKAVEKKGEKKFWLDGKEMIFALNQKNAERKFYNLYGYNPRSCEEL